MYSNKAFYKIIDEICKEKNIEQKLISYGWIRQLKKNEKTKYIMGYQLDLNNINSYKIVGDKYATYSVLKDHNIPTIEHRIIFNPKTRSLYYKNKFIEEAKELLRENQNKLVIKANSSYKGKDVYFCDNEQEIEAIVKKLFDEDNDTLSACPYLDIEYEYRVIYLCGDILFVYKKKKPYVVGNGKDTINELINKKFPNYKMDIYKNLDLQRVPANEENVTVSWKHNLSNGAEPLLIDRNDEFIDVVKDVAVKSAKAVNISFASVDIAVTEDKKVLNMEINGNVCMNKFVEIVPNGYEIAKSIFSKAIDKMFEENLDSLQ